MAIFQSAGSTTDFTPKTISAVISYQPESCQSTEATELNNMKLNLNENFVSSSHLPTKKYWNLFGNLLTQYPSIPTTYNE